MSVTAPEPRILTDTATDPPRVFALDTAGELRWVWTAPTGALVHVGRVVAKLDKGGRLVPTDPRSALRVSIQRVAAQLAQDAVA